MCLIVYEQVSKIINNVKIFKGNFIKRNTINFEQHVAAALIHKCNILAVIIDYSNQICKFRNYRRTK